MDYSTQLWTALQALKATRAPPHHDAQDVLRRIARRVRELGMSQRDEELGELGELLLDAPPGRVEARVEAVLNGIRRRIFSPTQRSGAVLVAISDSSVRSAVTRSMARVTSNIIECDGPRAVWSVLEGDAVAAVVMELDSTDVGLVLLERMQRDPTLRSMPRIVLGPPSLGAVALALGAWEVFQPTSDPEGIAGCVSAFLGQDDRVGLELLDPSPLGLPGDTELKRQFRTLQLESEVSGTTHCLVLARPVGLADGAKRYGDEFRVRVLEACATVLTEAFPSPHACFTWTDMGFALLLPLSEKRASAALQGPIDAIAKVAFSTTSTEPWFTRLAIGGVAVRGMSFERSLGGAARMLTLGEQAGAMMPVITALSAAAPPRHRVLVVEDDPTVAEIVSRTMERLGLEAIIKEDGLAALDIATELKFDLIVTDIVMPFLDGLSLIERLRDIPRYRRTPMIVLTSLGTERHVVQGFELGANDYIVKPFNTKILAARAKALLERSTG